MKLNSFTTHMCYHLSIYVSSCAFFFCGPPWFSSVFFLILLILITFRLSGKAIFSLLDVLIVRLFLQVQTFPLIADPHGVGKSHRISDALEN